MTNFDWVVQPPQAAKYTFLVDELSDYAYYGRTTDGLKIRYNRQLMGVNFNLEVGVNTALSELGVSAVLPLGRYITLFEISRNEQSAAMTFIDHQIGFSSQELKALLSPAFSSDLVAACVELQSLLTSTFTPADYMVRLERVK